MGLFGRLFHRDNDDDPGDLSGFEGMRLEIMDEQGDLLFAARAGLSWDGSIELRPITVPRVRPGTKFISVEMRGYDAARKQAVHMEGDITPHSDGTWTVDDLKVTGRDNDRAFFRQEMLIGGSVMPLRQRGISERSCRIINISAGGACVQFPAECMVGEKLLLKFRLGDGGQPMALMCVVRRVTRRQNFYEYGCEFIDLSPALEEQITRTIMNMQREHRRLQ